MQIYKVRRTDPGVVAYQSYSRLKVKFGTVVLWIFLILLAHKRGMDLDGKVLRLRAFFVFSQVNTTFAAFVHDFNLFGQFLAN